MVNKRVAYSSRSVWYQCCIQWILLLTGYTNLHSQKRTHLHLGSCLMLPSDDQRSARTKAKPSTSNCESAKSECSHVSVSTKRSASLYSKQTLVFTRSSSILFCRDLMLLKIIPGKDALFLRHWRRWRMPPLWPLLLLCLFTGSLLTSNGKLGGCATIVGPENRSSKRASLVYIYIYNRCLLVTRCCRMCVSLGCHAHYHPQEPDNKIIKAEVIKTHIRTQIVHSKTHI